MTHIKDINKRHINGQDSRHLYLAKKTEKIASAIFMVTDLFSEDIQKIKKTLQEESISVLELVHELHAPAKFENTILLNLEKKFTYIVSLLEVALHVHVISESNANILIKEIYGCIERVQSIRSAPLSELQHETLTSSSFELPALMQPFTPGEEISETQEEQSSSKSHVSHNSPVQKNLVAKVPNTPMSLKKNVKKTPSTVSSSKAQPSKSQDKSKRQEMIIGYLQKDTLMNIQDIYDSIEGVSSKTIQRDLNELIKDNKVIREGNKRWATYKRA